MRGEKPEAAEESTLKLVLYGLLDCVAVVLRSIYSILPEPESLCMQCLRSFFWSLIRSCCYPVKEGFTRRLKCLAWLIWEVFGSMERVAPWIEMLI